MYIISKGYVNLHKYTPERQKALHTFHPSCHMIPNLRFTLSWAITIFSALAILSFH